MEFERAVAAEDLVPEKQLVRLTSAKRKLSLKLIKFQGVLQQVQ
jgi:hypothetical protein